MLIGVTDAFAFVGFGFFEFTDTGGDLTDDQLVGSFDQELDAVCDRD